MKAKEKTLIDDPLFHYIKPTNNDQFSEMKGIDLQDLLYYIENYYLELRSQLGFDDTITFGTELEFEEAMRDRIEKQTRQLLLHRRWQPKHDRTLKNGFEIASPILKDTKKDWNELKLICAILEKNAIIGEHSGGHIHIGTQVLGEKTESWINFIKLWSVYENIIYRFVYGDFLTPRTSMSHYAVPIAQQLWKSYQSMRSVHDLSMNDFIHTIPHARNQAINFNNISDFTITESENTIEFRCPNGSLDPVVWQNNVNLLVNILLYSKSDRYNDDLITERRNINQDKYYGLEWYGEIYLQQALELCDMLFTNNFDKVYFLRQYLKSFQIANQPLSKTKTFTKK